MSAPPDTRARPAADPERPATAPAGLLATAVCPLVAVLTVAAGASALVGVFRDTDWLVPLLVTIGSMALVGQAARATGSAWWTAVPAQLVVLGCLLTALFSEHGLLWVLPGPGALAELGAHISGVPAQIEGSIAPVTVTPGLLLVVCMLFGLMAVLVDALAAVGYGPAACGLVLLCAYTVPTTLARDALPDWTLIAGAAGFAALLVVDHQRGLARNRATPGPGDADPASGGGLRGAARRRAARGSTAPVTVVVTAAAVAVALLLGVLAAAVVGTEGRFPGNSPAAGGDDELQFGLNPFTSLRGQLEKPDPADLLRVRGLPDATYLRALTLPVYDPGQGWQLPGRRGDAALDRTLPTGLPTPVTAPSTVVEIESVGYRDRWLPLAGLPLGVTGTVPGRWRYDVGTSTAYADGPLLEPRWVERAVLPAPGADDLIGLPPTTDIGPNYLDTEGVDPRIGRLTATVTSKARTPFAKAVVLNRFFLDPANGYRYSLTTAPGTSGDALVDFLLRGRIGYCEQFASAMAVMLRTVGVPARVAVGFTPGPAADGVRTITTRDAHAWVEAFFPGQGWLTFDPTPTGDGRSVVPPYVAEAPAVPSVPPPPDLAVPPAPQPPQQPERGPGQAPRPDPTQDGAGSSPSPEPGPPDLPGGAAGPQPGEQPGASGSDPGGDAAGGSGADGGGSEGEAGISSAQMWAALLGLLLGLGVVALLGAPATARRLARRHRETVAGRGGAAGAAAAWREVLAESRDHGGDPAGNATVRATARRLVSDHRLDADAAEALRTVVGGVERGWYGAIPDQGSGPDLVAALRAVRAGFDRAAPPTITDRVWPRSMRPAPSGRATAADGTGVDVASGTAAARHSAPRHGDRRREPVA